ncbi:MAG: TolC family protein [Planctomycetota bacterium]|jgi:outer membrane protein TolC
MRARRGGVSRATVGTPALAAAVLAAGCAAPYSLEFAERSAAAGDIRSVVERRLGEVTAPDPLSSGAGDYQRDEDMRRFRDESRAVRGQRARAMELFKEGPAVLSKWLAFALELNDSVRSAREAILAEQADGVAVRARLSPRLSYTLSTEEVHEDGSPDAHALDHYLRLSQTLFEFGRENPADVAVREAERDALFAYEDTVRWVLSNVRKKFFTILLRQQQIAERRKLLEKFKERHDKMVRLEKEQRVLHVDVLTARLNVLNEEARINSLENELLRQRIDLLHLVGLPVSMTDVAVLDELEDFTLELDDIIAIGLRRSTTIAEARAGLDEQRRVVRELAWRHAPALVARAGKRTESGAAGVELANTDGTFAVSAFGEKHLQDEAASFSTGYGLLDTHGEGWSAELALTVPILDGRERRGELLREQGELRQAVHALRQAIDSAEADVRKAYQTMLERRKELDILRETVRISYARLGVQDRLKELGRITDNELETFRNRFFADQDAFFRGQISLMEAQEDLRHTVRFFEPLPARAAGGKESETGEAEQ